MPSQKRKFDAPKDPTELYKSAKLNVDGNARSSHSTIIEVEKKEDAVAGPELPSDLDNEEDENTDEEGRFFGGGVSRDTREIMDFVNEQDEDTKIEMIDSVWLRKTALSFEKKISKNAELRAKFEGDPHKFMASEADLDSSIKALSILAEHSELYSEFAKLGCVASLVSLLAHENTDIAIGAIEIIGELIDEDVDADSEQWDALVGALLDADLVDLLHANFSRLNEEVETDRNGVYHILEVLESLASDPTVTQKLGKHESIIPWLLTRTIRKEAPISQNKQYATEVLSILLQSSALSKEHFIRIDGVDLYLQALSVYRKHSPQKSTPEEEYLENLFDSLTCILCNQAGKTAFQAAEGIQLSLLLIKENPVTRSSALRLLDHLTTTPPTTNAAEYNTTIITSGGLKTLFTIFMKKKPSSSATTTAQQQTTTEHILSIQTSMLRTLPAESPARIRLLAKFIENDFHKIQHLLNLRREISIKLELAERDIESLQLDTDADATADRNSEAAMSRRLDAGLSLARCIDEILAWLVAEDDGARREIVRGLEGGGLGFDALRRTLRGLRDGIDLSDEVGGDYDDDGGHDGERERERERDREEKVVVREILATLMGYLQ